MTSNHHEDHHTAAMHLAESMKEDFLQARRDIEADLRSVEAHEDDMWAALLKEQQEVIRARLGIVTDFLADTGRHSMRDWLQKRLVAATTEAQRAHLGDLLQMVKNHEEPPYTRAIEKDKKETSLRDRQEQEKKRRILAKLPKIQLIEALEAHPESINKMVAEQKAA